MSPPNHRISSPPSETKISNTPPDLLQSPFFNLQARSCIAKVACESDKRLHIATGKGSDLLWLSDFMIGYTYRL